MRYGDLHFEEPLRQWIHGVERDTDDCESDIDNSDNNLSNINKHNSDLSYRNIDGDNILNISEQKIVKWCQSVQKTCYSYPAKLKEKIQLFHRLCKYSFQVRGKCENYFPKLKVQIFQYF